MSKGKRKGLDPTVAAYLDRALRVPLLRIASELGVPYDELKATLDEPHNPVGQRLRRRLTRGEPLLFALTYLSHHLRSEGTGNRITLSEVHLDWAEKAKTLMLPVTASGEHRNAYIAPREMGKSTWHFLLIPAWAAAHEHSRFIAAFADSATQAETHLATFKLELESNTMLRADYPELCAPLTRQRGVVAADRVSLYRASSGFIFAARGMDTRTLGLKVGALRPDYLLLDDIEPGEESYSAALMQKRLRTLQDTVLPLNDKARVVLVGTVTMAGSIIHELVRFARGMPPLAAGKAGKWVAEDGWKAHYYAPIVGEGKARRSVWPARWSLKHLERIKHTRAYLKNYANDPLGADGDYWTVDDFTHGELEGCTRTLLSIDPAVTTKASSDYTGLAVVAWQPPRKRGNRGRCYVKAAEQVKLSGAQIRLKVLAMIADDPSIGLVLIETNQGGEVWQEILWGLPVKVRTKHQSVKKEVRAAATLNHYQRKRVVHAKGLDSLEGQMVSFPDAPHDDMVDAVGTGVSYFLDRNRSKTTGVATASYA